MSTTTSSQAGRQGPASLKAGTWEVSHGVASQHVLKLALQGHGPEPEAWRLLPYIVPSTMDAGEHFLTLFWRDSYEVIPVHVLRQARLTPISSWRAGPPDLAFVHYLMAIVAEVSRYNLKDLGWFNFGATARAHFPSRKRASGFWSGIDDILAELKPVLTDYYKWCLSQQGVFL